MSRDNDNELFPKDIEFGKLVKKAKRKSFIKTSLISLVSSLLVIFVLYFIGDFVMQQRMQKEIELVSSLHSIRGANIEDTGTSFDYSPFSAIATTDRIKKVAGVPIPWGGEKMVFTVFGTTKLLQTAQAFGSGTIDDDRIPMFFQGERELEFFHPKVNYKNIYDDRDLLKHIDDHTLVEMAFSFDKGYSIAEVQEIFKGNLAWYWVDTFTKGNIKEHNEMNTPDDNELFFHEYLIGAHGVYGFLHGYGEDSQQADSFIATIKFLKSKGGENKGEVKSVYNTLTNNGKKKLTGDNLKIIGVVVTGKPSELQKFNDLKMVRGAILGATVDEY